MTSSLLLKKRRENPQWRIGNPDAPLGMWDNNYVTSGSHPCVPGFMTIPIGNPYGAKMCQRLPDKKCPFDEDQINMNKYNGVNRYSADLYRPWRKTAIQEWNPIDYYDRKPPNLEYLIQGDYISRPFRYNGTGVQVVHTPVTSPLNQGGNKVEADTHYYEYGYSYTNSPPYKYDITRYEQPYPVWRAEKLYGPNPQHTQQEMDTLDQIYDVSRI